MKVIIFIGHFKTGSTSLQAFMSLNAPKLAQAGILYPMVMEDARSRYRRLRDWRIGQKASLPLNLREAHNVLALRLMSDVTGDPMPDWHQGVPATDALFAYMRREIESARPSSVVLVAELMASLGEVSKSLILRLREFFDGCETKILVTFRRPDAYLPSWHAQRLKFRDAILPLRTSGLQDYLDTGHVDYRKVVRPWQDVFSDAQFQINEYQDVVARGGSVEAFKQDSGLVFPAGLQDVPRENPSIRAAFREVLRLGVQKLPPRMGSHLVSWTLRNQSRIDHTPDDDIELFGAKNRQKLLDGFVPAHRYLEAATGRSPFFNNLDEIAQTRPVAEMDAARAALPNLKRRAKTRPPRKPVAEFLESFQFPPQAT